MTDTIHSLLAEMADELDNNRKCLLGDGGIVHPLAARARAVLAAAPMTATDAMLASTPDHARLARHWYLKGCNDTYKGVQDLVERQTVPWAMIAPPAPAQEVNHD